MWSSGHNEAEPKTRTNHVIGSFEVVRGEYARSVHAVYSYIVIMVVR